MTSVDFSKGLVPTIILDDQNGDVLMLAYMNEESYQKTLETGYTWFFRAPETNFGIKARQADILKK